MANEIDAVIAALKVELQQAEKNTCAFWKYERCNRWIRQLPWVLVNRWSNLELHGYSDGDVSRHDFITHVKATLAYLETKRGQANFLPSAWLWPFTDFSRSAGNRPTQADEPVDAEFTEVPPQQRKLPKPKVVK
ncbi:MAG: hypothetical protein NW216_06625 [Hyphomicrobium sp.]|nr:hypothetical protein [Hyphomicrobium sp.]